ARELIDELNITKESDLDKENNNQLEIDQDLELNLQNKIREISS
ncbi:13150_t:CDS:1, partial [Cetraspora pellucida]